MTRYCQKNLLDARPSARIEKGGNQLGERADRDDEWSKSQAEDEEHIYRLQYLSTRFLYHSVGGSETVPIHIIEELFHLRPKVFHCPLLTTYLT